MLKETFEERLKWLDPNHYEYSNKKVIVRETAEDGKAEVCCNVSNFALKIDLGKKNRVHYLRRQNVADGVIFEFIESEKVIIHIIECKRTIKKEIWKKAKEQFEGALLNSLGLMGILGLSDIHNVIFYTAYRNDSISSVNLRNAPGNPSPVKDWIEDKISVLSLSQAAHRKIELNSEGKGNISI